MSRNEIRGGVVLGDTAPPPHPVRGGVPAAGGGDKGAAALGLCEALGLNGAVRLLACFVPCCRSCSCCISNSDSRDSREELLELGMLHPGAGRGGVVDWSSIAGLTGDEATAVGFGCAAGASAVAVRELLRRLRFFLPLALGPGSCTKTTNESSSTSLLLLGRSI